MNRFQDALFGFAVVGTLMFCVWAVVYSGSSKAREYTQKCETLGGVVIVIKSNMHCLGKVVFIEVPR